MKLRCVLNESSKLPRSFFEAGYTPRSDCHVSVNRIYQAAGVGIMAGVICYLIRDDTGLPNWTPAPFFEVLDNSVGSGWSFVYFHRKERLAGLLDALFAPCALADDVDLPDALMARDKEALERFAQVLERESAE